MVNNLIQHYHENIVRTFFGAVELEFNPSDVDTYRIFRDNVIRIARQERDTWGNGARLETHQNMEPHLIKYWKATASWITDSAAREKIRKIPPDPWSAAFISWVMQSAGAGPISQFRYSGSHSQYIAQAKRGNTPPEKYQPGFLAVQDQ